MDSWSSYFKDTRPGLTHTELSAVEREMGISLPGALRALYASVGAGRFAANLFVAADGHPYDFHQLIPVRPAEPANGLVCVYNFLVLEQHFIPEQLVPFAYEGGGNFYCIHRNDDSVWYCDYELNSDGTLNSHVHISSSLGNLLERLMKGRA